jgi:hypothetical protein
MADFPQIITFPNTFFLGKCPKFFSQILTFQKKFSQQTRFWEKKTLGAIAK